LRPNSYTAICKCNEGFYGEYCEIKECKNNCNGKGRCVDGECKCTGGFFGTDCS